MFVIEVCHSDGSCVPEHAVHIGGGLGGYKGSTTSFTSWFTHVILVLDLLKCLLESCT